MSWIWNRFSDCITAFQDRRNRRHPSGLPDNPAHACVASRFAKSLSDQCKIPENLHVARRITHSRGTRLGIRIELWLPGSSIRFHPVAGSASSRLMKAWGTQVLIGLISTPMTMLFVFTLSVKPNPPWPHRSDNLTTTHQRLTTEQWAVSGAKCSENGVRLHPNEHVHFGVDVGVLLIKKSQLQRLHRPRRATCFASARWNSYTRILSHTYARLLSVVLVHPTHPQERRARRSAHRSAETHAPTLI